MKNLKLGLLLALITLTQFAFAIEFNKYHDVAEINAFLKQSAEANSEIASLQKLGLSPQKREINYLILSIGDASKKEAIYFNGTHHGDEKSSTEAVLGLVDYFIKNKKEPQVQAYLQRFALYFQPLMNPDGHANNTRTTANGTDPNRDYSYPEKKDEDSFKQVEAQLVKKLADKVKFVGALAYHSGIVEILWPWCYTATPSHDETLLATVTKNMAQATGVTRYMPSHRDYPTTGEFIDYLYWKHGTVALTVELSRMKTPPIEQIPGIITTAVKGAMSFMNSLDAARSGQLKMAKKSQLYSGFKGTGRSADLLE